MSHLSIADSPTGTLMTVTTPPPAYNSSMNIDWAESNDILRDSPPNYEQVVVKQCSDDYHNNMT